ncbi:MAG TPA: hypothetical protein VNG13_00070 [Mycobacteriales bacterium]|nr:hypothetical protein [Mycobacteriales bacterium]
MTPLTRFAAGRHGLFLAHAFGKRYDLPIPLYLFVAGGAVIVFVSFLIVLPTPVATGPLIVAEDRTRGPRHGARAAVSVGGVVLLCLAAGLAGSQLVAENILPTVFWLIVWIAVPISCGLLGDWTRPVNPFAALAGAVDRASVRRVVLGGPALAWPRWLGWWPATVLFFAFASGELIFNATATLPQVTALGLICYGLLTAVGAVVFGAERWLERGELFSVLFATWGRLGWFRFGAAGRRGPLGGLDGTVFEPTVSRVSFVLLLLVSVSFDGLLATPSWKNARLYLSLHVSRGFVPGTMVYELGEVVVFLALLGFAWLLFGGFAWAVKRAGRLGGGPVHAIAGLLPSVLPISLGYLVAHNLEYLFINGQLLLPLLGNPAGLRSWPRIPYPFNDNYEVNINLVPSSVAWYIAVALIILVHVAAVVLAHRYLARTARPERARRAEWPWIAAMVGYTMSSLWLLAQPIAQGGG